MNSKLTAQAIVRAISYLPKENRYFYVNPKNKAVIKICRIEGPEGPIVIKRWNPTNQETEESAKEDRISVKMLWRFANACNTRQPINVDRVLAGSYNTRSVLEALVAYTPEFHICMPGRIEDVGGNVEVKPGHKHIVWNPESPHKSGEISRIDSEQVISEIPTPDIVYDALSIPFESRTDDFDIEIKRRHAQIQIALMMIGSMLSFKTWIARNDRGIVYDGRKLAEYNGVLASLKEVKILKAFEDAMKAAQMIDVIWFKNDKLMPAVMEIEHSTGVTSGLERMLHFKNSIPPIQTRYVVVAADAEREKVVREANKPTFKELEIRFFPYSSVEELYGLCQRRGLTCDAVNESFLDAYMEPLFN